MAPRPGVRPILPAGTDGGPAASENVGRRGRGHSTESARLRPISSELIIWFRPLQTPDRRVRVASHLMSASRTALPAGSRRRPHLAALADDPLLAAFAQRGPSRVRSFRGRRVVVTGGAAGIGRAIAVGFALAGARVTVLDKNEAHGRATAALLRRLSPGSGFVRVNLADAGAVRRAGRLFAGRRGADVLINNAATVGRIAPFHELPETQFAEVMRANLFGPCLLSQQAAAGLIKARRPGTIVNILTIQTELPLPGYSAYIASKGGLEALTLSMAVDLAPHGIRVNAVRVGSVLTENFLAVLPEKLKREMNSGAGVEALHGRAATLLGRMGLPAEIARVVLFLASEEASYLTGSIVRADGGRAISRRVEPLL